MRHSRIAKSTRHKKLKVVNGPNEFNYVHDNLLQRNKEQQIPRKLAQIMEFKAKNKQVDKTKATTDTDSTKKKKKLNKKYSTLTVKTGAQTTIEKGMTRFPKPLPETVDKGIMESDYQFLNRLNRMVAKSIAEANLEEHFDVDLNAKAKNPQTKLQNSLTTTTTPTTMNTSEHNNKKSITLELSDEDREKIEKKRNKRKLKDLKRKEKKQKRQIKLNKMKESQEFSFKKEIPKFGDIVHQPPTLNFGKKPKLNVAK